MPTKEDLLKTFREQWPNPTRVLAIELLRAHGFKHRGEMEKIAVYKHAELPDHPVTIPSKSEKLKPGMAQRIVSVIEMLDDEGES